MNEIISIEEVDGLVVATFDDGTTKSGDELGAWAVENGGSVVTDPDGEVVGFTFPTEG